MSPQPITENTLFYGDNLPILREFLPNESVDLIYLSTIKELLHGAEGKNATAVWRL